MGRDGVDLGLNSTDFFLFLLNFCIFSWVNLYSLAVCLYFQIFKFFFLISSISLETGPQKPSCCHAGSGTPKDIVLKCFLGAILPCLSYLGLYFTRIYFLYMTWVRGQLSSYPILKKLSFPHAQMSLLCCNSNVQILLGLFLNFIFCFIYLFIYSGASTTLC